MILNQSSLQNPRNPMRVNFPRELIAYAVHQKGRDEPPEIGVRMKPKAKAKTHEQPLIVTMRLELAIDMDHELVRLA